MIFKNSTFVEETLNGDTYKWHYAFNQPAIENLLKLKIPIFRTIRSNDYNVPVDSTNLIKSEFIQLQKNYLIYKVHQTAITVIQKY